MDTEKAFKYYCKGLTSKEIALLMRCSYRTVQNHMTRDNWKQRRKDLKRGSNSV